MGPNKKGVINELLPTFRFKVGGFNGIGFKVFHENVSDNMGEG